MSTTLDEIMALHHKAAFELASPDVTERIGEADSALRTRLASLVADAERYQWLREQPDNTDAPRIDVVQWIQGDESANEGNGLRGEALDNAIDVARNQTKEPQ